MREPRADLLRPWCQALDHFRNTQQWPGHMAVPCGRTFDLRTEQRFGVLYNFCPAHQTREALPEPRRPWWKRVLRRS